jgi:hypothetical protein
MLSSHPGRDILSALVVKHKRRPKATRSTDFSTKHAERSTELSPRACQSVPPAVAPVECCLNRSRLVRPSIEM